MNMRNSEGKAGVHLAAADANFDVLKVLQKNGYSLVEENADGLTPMDLLKEKRKKRKTERDSRKRSLEEIKRLCDASIELIRSITRDD